ncbi:MAG: alpha/beta fold hydrolase [Deltaproteobacteria bacterium]|nr:alpha/beta fold hydrolase [Deltaproteobacteria bacterium]
MQDSLPVAALAALLAALAALALWAWLRRRGRLPGRRRWRPVRPPLPVVLVHGLFGFDELAIGRKRHAYFRGITPRLQKAGRKVIQARLPAAGSVERRAEALAAAVRALPDRRVILLAHSMGGLDARHAIARLGLAPRVAALVSVGTPHRGTPLADLTADLAGRLGIVRALAFAGVSLEALRDLTGERLLRFNEEAADVRSVAYASVVGTVRRKRRVHPLLLPGHLWLAEKSGDNDGVVPADSQRWGEVVTEIDADHWAQIGWSRHFDAGRFYVRILEELEASGL